MLQLVGDDVGHRGQPAARRRRRRRRRRRSGRRPTRPGSPGRGRGRPCGSRARGRRSPASGPAARPRGSPIVEPGGSGSGRIGRTLADAEPVEGLQHEAALVDRVQQVGVAVGRGLHELLLRPRVPVAQRGVGPQRVAEREQLGELVTRRRHDVEVDAERRPVVVHVAEHQGPGRREGGEPALPLEPEREQRVGDLRDLVRVGLDAEVDDVLARHPGHRRAADVLGDRPGPRGRDQAGDVERDVPRARIPRVERRGQPLVGADRELGHRPECR